MLNGPWDRGLQALIQRGWRESHTLVRAMSRPSRATGATLDDIARKKPTARLGRSAEPVENGGQIEKRLVVAGIEIGGGAPVDDGLVEPSLLGRHDPEGVVGLGGSRIEIEGLGQGGSRSHAVPGHQSEGP
jgi:hypothetical protein